MHYLVFCFCLCLSPLFAKTYISNINYYEVNGRGCSLGRMGDHLILYTKAKWFSHKYNIQYLFREFPYAQYFALSDLEPYRAGEFERIQERTIGFDETLVEKGLLDNTCYAVNYFYSSKKWEWNGDVGLWHDTIRDKAFLSHLRKMLTPKIAIPKLELPDGIRSVAVHIRKGSYFDEGGFFSEQLFDIFPGEEPSEFPLVDFFLDVGSPYKFPPLQFYIDQIKKLSKRFEDEPLHVVLFTDYHDQKELLTLLKNQVALENVRFSPAAQVEFLPLGNAMAPGIECSLRDLIMMTQCDCLIRSGSNFAQMAHLLGDFEVVYFPLDAKWFGNRLTYSRIGCIESHSKIAH